MQLGNGNPRKVPGESDGMASATPMLRSAIKKNFVGSLYFASID